jgi:hypothetical protein
MEEKWRPNLIFIQNSPFLVPALGGPVSSRGQNDLQRYWDVTVSAGSSSPHKIPLSRKS